MRQINFILLFRDLILCMCTFSVVYLMSLITLGLIEAQEFFFLVLLLVTGCSLAYLMLVEGWGKKGANHLLHPGEQGFVVLSLIGAMFVFYYSLELTWVIFVLELLSFIVFGSSAVFNRVSFIKSVEGSLSYILPAFVSFVCMMMGILSQGKGYFLSFYSNELIVLGLLVKLASFPFLIWPFQVFQGCSYETIVVLAILNKVSVLLIVTQYIEGCYALLYFSGILSIILGSLLLVNAKQLRVVLAMTTVTSSGWLLVYVAGVKLNQISSPVMEASTLSEVILNSTYGVMGFYFLFFALSFALLVWASKMAEEGGQSHFYLSGGAQERTIGLTTWLGGLACVGLAGVPPLASFYFKFLLLESYSQEELTLLSFLMLASSLLNTYGYLRVFLSVTKRLGGERVAQQKWVWLPASSFSPSYLHGYSLFYVLSLMSLFSLFGLLLLI